ncbi:MAG: vancomycin resistance protein [Ruminococcaceae bacterium]|nr:vancomycin resistance protein [Oscillospiraceae bacterium]
MARKNFCEMNPFFYALSVHKERIKRHIKNLFSKDKLARKKSDDTLPYLVWSHSSNMIKRAPGVDLTLQKNKAVNINIAGSAIHKTLIRPGQTFSFWDRVGKITKRKGYLEGRIIKDNKLIAGMGGGLCNLSNTIHLLILHSPMTVTEFHKHSDALAPDEGKRVPFAAGTSVGYNYIDYRFRNDTDSTVQLLVWCEEDTLYAELRSDTEFPYSYELVEEDHRFVKEGEKYYRRSMIYRNITDKSTGKLVEKELVLNNRSEVMYDYDLIDKSLIR